MNEFDSTMDKLKKVVAKYWGYNEFLPLQEKAMAAALQKRDSVVVLPTGGGKSLCFQAPALVMPGIAIVVSPLLSLMKDQVDTLVDNGISAARLDSTQNVDEQRRIATLIQNRELKILYLSPERLLGLKFIDFLRQFEISLFAIDEAHCISMWGHDFRQEYRQLRVLRELFPGIAIHAFTATATNQVRHDIAEQLQLKQPEILVGSFDRPNLIFKAEPRYNGIEQITRILDQHKNESGIIYCIRRDDVDEMHIRLEGLGYKTLPYHAGMDNNDRKNNQQAFIEEKVNIIVATVAFGMGIDKSNVRYVIHAGMPKSLEHYQQESGRAGRDGLEAECCLFYSGGDYHTWNYLIKGMPEEVRKIAQLKIGDIYDYCTGTVCRHKAIVRYFGQELESDSCGACDVCLGSFEPVPDSLTIAQKILSCIVRLDQFYGADYTAKVLNGSKDKKVLGNNHDKLTTYGILSEYSMRIIRDWIEQLTSQQFITKYGDYRILKVTEKGRETLKGKLAPKLYKSKAKDYDEADAYRESWAGVDNQLFEELRLLRKEIADDKGLPAFVVFSDAVLRDLARFRPTSARTFMNIKGVGEAKSRQYSKRFTRLIEKYSREHDLPIDLDSYDYDNFSVGRRKKSRNTQLINPSKEAAFQFFKQGCTIDVVANKIGRAISTTAQYLEEFIEKEKIVDPSPWVTKSQFEEVTAAIKEVDSEMLKPVHELLEGKIDYETIRICRACLKNKG